MPSKPIKLTTEIRERIGYAWFTFQMNWAHYVILALLTAFVFLIGYEIGSAVNA